ncbi:unnamed protein product [Sympodiomycopsis kandeliae]
MLGTIAPQSTMTDTYQLVSSSLTALMSRIFAPPAHTCRGILYSSSGALPLISTITFLFLILFCLHMTLPSTSPTVSYLRFLAFPLFLVALFPFIEEGSGYTFGNDFRDIAIPSFVWLPLSEATRICFLAVWDSHHERAPRWIVPESQKHRWPGAVPVRKQENGQVIKGEMHTTDHDDGSLAVPSSWYYVPHPRAFTCLRLLWAIDNMTLRRPGTSLLFPSQQRALEWSLPTMEKTSAIYSQAARLEQKGDIHSAKQLRRTAPIWFGQIEWNALISLLQMTFLYYFVTYVKSLDLSIKKGTYHPQNFFTLPLPQQYFLTFGLGALVAFPNSSLQSLIEYPLQSILPTTALIPVFQRPLCANGPKDFWNKRWHQFLRRDFANVAKLVPGAREIPLIRVIATFAVSAAEHSFVFSTRFRKAPSSIPESIYLFIQPCIYFFFLSQVVLIMIEEYCLPKNSLWARRLLLWIGLLTTGRYVTAHLWELGCFDTVEFTNWSRSTTILTDIWQDFRRIWLL